MENYVQYGTPLESLDENNIHLSKAPKLSDQVVKDKQGKRRFHGAFTGGFSAGYFNSVGTKEGWTPSSFVSSRSKKAEQKVDNDPVAYMDDEDLSDFGIAFQKIQTSSKFEDPFEHPLKRKRNNDSGPIPGQPILHDLLKPVNLTMGMKFLMKLGWRPGQGIGPRLSKQNKIKIRRTKKANSSIEARNSTDFDDDDDDTDCDTFLPHNFAPDDTETLFSVNVKSNLFGLGYKPLERTNILGHDFSSESTSSFRMTEKNKKLSIRGQAFGVGAFEDEDEDIYMKEDMSDYDFDMGPENKINKQRLQSRWDTRLSLIGETLEGFHLSSKPLEKSKKIPLPILPPDYKPWHESRKSRFSESMVIGKERLTSDERRLLVGSDPSIEIRSGFKDKDKEEYKIEAHDLTFSASTSLKATEKITSPKYRPFASNPEKQKRYELYISSTCVDRDSIFPSYMTEWEREREKGEFQRAQAFNRPLSFSMSSRFTSAVLEDSVTNLQEGFNSMKDIKPVSGEERVSYFESELPEDMKAAKQKMFGRLTQSYVDWVPDKLLCKRFNVPNPYSSAAAGVQSKRKEHKSIFSIIPDIPPNKLPQSSYNEEEEGIESASSCIAAEELTHEEENYGLKVSISNPPTIDLYNAIFQDSSSEDEEEEKEKISQIDSSSGNHPKSGVFKDYSNVENISSVEINIEGNESSENEKIKGPDILSFSKQNLNMNRLEKGFSSSFSNKGNFNKPIETENSSQSMKAKGIFKGIDFSALNQYRNLENKKSSPKPNLCDDGDYDRTRTNHSSDNSPNSNHAEISSSIKETESHFDSEDEYGPALPPHMIKGGSVVEPNATSVNIDDEKFIFETPISSSLLKVEKKLKKAKKQKKHKHKHKKHKKESKRQK